MYCCWYYKGSSFQANHNQERVFYGMRITVVDTTKVVVFKQITTLTATTNPAGHCCWYYKGSSFQANHNYAVWLGRAAWTVVDTTKVVVFKQITTSGVVDILAWDCCWYYKGSSFQANHNVWTHHKIQTFTVVDTTKVVVFKQITTIVDDKLKSNELLLILQR